MNTDVEYRRTLGAYLLGALEPDEEERLEKHVRSCVPCHAELLGLGVVVADMAVLDTALTDPAAAATGGGEAPTGWEWATAQDAVTKKVPGSPLRRRFFAVAAAAASVAAASGIGFVVGGSDPYSVATETPDRPVGTRTVRGWNSETAVEATAVLTPARWGTNIQLTITGTQAAVAPGTGCTLLTVSRLGTTGQAASWAIPASSPTTAGERIGGATAIPMHQLLMLLVVTDYGRPLLTVPIR